MKKAAIITGASRGIGLAIARRMYDDGYNVVATGTKPYSDYAETFADFEPSSFRYVQADISNQDGRESIIHKAVDSFGRIDILVNNAGVAPLERRPLLEMTEESFDRVINVNTKGNLFLSQLAAKQMIEQEAFGKKRGTIINISSCSAEVSSPNRGEYCISKAGVSMLTKLFADALAEYSIFVHEIRPGVVISDMTSNVKEKYDKLIESGAFPIQRWGTGEDVANAVSVFAGDEFTYTTGNYIDVDGGFHIKRL